MSFLQHLEELRKRLIISIIAVVIGMAIAWPLVPTVQKIITRPLNEPSITQKWHYAIESFVLQKFPNAAKNFGLEQPEPPKVNPHKLNYMAPLEPFFVQMKISLISGLALAFPLILYQMWLFFAPALYPKERKIVVFFIPLGTVAFILGDLFFLHLVWPLVISFSLRYESEFLFSMLTGLALAFPVVLYQIWLFFAPALYPQEKKYVYFFIPFGTLAFVLGDFFCLNLVWPLIIRFSLAYESDFLFSMLNLTAFVNFCLRLLILFGLIFELPLILLILARVGLVEVDLLRRHRRTAILLSAVVAAFHADVLTMMAIAIPIYLMYELSILTVRLFGRPAPREDEEAEPLPAETGLGPPSSS